MTQVSNALIRRATSVVFGVCLFLSVGGLSADSRPAPAGGFLYSQYLKHASAVGDSSLSGSFVVKTNTSALAKGQKRVWNAVSSKISALPVNKWALDYLFDEESDIASRFQKTVGETGWQLADIVLDESLLAATEGARASGAIRTADFSIESSLGGRKGNIAVDILGALRETDENAVAWQFRAYKGEEEAAGVNAGLIYRWVAQSNALLGVNAFLDYETHDVEDFWRWSVGGEVRSPWVDVYANYYDAITDPVREINSEGVFSNFYSASGYDVELDVHSPRYPWLIGSATYYVWDGEFGDDDDDGVRFGLKLAPTNTPLELEVEYENGDEDDDWGGRISYTHRFGGHQTAAARGAAFNPRDYFFVPVKREYTQRIRESASGFSGDTGAELLSLRFSSEGGRVFVGDNSNNVILESNSGALAVVGSVGLTPGAISTSDTDTFVFTTGQNQDGLIVRTELADGGKVTLYGTNDAGGFTVAIGSEMSFGGSNGSLRLRYGGMFLNGSGIGVALGNEGNIQSTLALVGDVSLSLSFPENKSDPFAQGGQPVTIFVQQGGVLIGVFDATINLDEDDKIVMLNDEDHEILDLKLEQGEITAETAVGMLRLMGETQISLSGGDDGISVMLVSGTVMVESGGATAPITMAGSAITVDYDEETGLGRIALVTGTVNIEVAGENGSVTVVSLTVAGQEVETQGGGLRIYEDINWYVANLDGPQPQSGVGMYPVNSTLPTPWVVKSGDRIAVKLRGEVGYPSFDSPPVTLTTDLVRGLDDNSFYVLHQLEGFGRAPEAYRFGLSPLKTGVVPDGVEFLYDYLSFITADHSFEFRVGKRNDTNEPVASDLVGDTISLTLFLGYNTTSRELFAKFTLVMPISVVGDPYFVFVPANHDNLTYKSGVNLQTRRAFEGKRTHNNGVVRHRVYTPNAADFEGTAPDSINVIGTLWVRGCSDCKDRIFSHPAITYTEITDAEVVGGDKAYRLSWSSDITYLPSADETRRERPYASRRLIISYPGAANVPSIEVEAYQFFVPQIGGFGETRAGFLLNHSNVNFARSGYTTGAFHIKLEFDENNENPKLITRDDINRRPTIDGRTDRGYPISRTYGTNEYKVLTIGITEVTLSSIRGAIGPQNITEGEWSYTTNSDDIIVKTDPDDSRVANIFFAEGADLASRNRNYDERIYVVTVSSHFYGATTDYTLNVNISYYQHRGNSSVNIKDVISEETDRELHDRGALATLSWKSGSFLDHSFLGHRNYQNEYGGFRNENGNARQMFAISSEGVINVPRRPRPQVEYGGCQENDVSIHDIFRGGITSAVKICIDSEVDYEFSGIDRNPVVTISATALDANIGRFLTVTVFNLRSKNFIAFTEDDRGANAEAAALFDFDNKFGFLSFTGNPSELTDGKVYTFGIRVRNNYMLNNYPDNNLVNGSIKYVNIPLSVNITSALLSGDGTNESPYEITTMADEDIPSSALANITFADYVPAGALRYEVTGDAAVAFAASSNGDITYRQGAFLESETHTIAVKISNADGSAGEYTSTVYISYAPGVCANGARVFTRASGNFSATDVNTAPLNTNVAAFIFALEDGREPGASSYGLWKLRAASGVFDGEFAAHAAEVETVDTTWNIGENGANAVIIPQFLYGTATGRAGTILKPGDVVGLARLGTITDESAHVYRVYADGSVDSSTPTPISHYYLAVEEVAADRKTSCTLGDGEFFLGADGNLSNTVLNNSIR